MRRQQGGNFIITELRDLLSGRSPLPPLRGGMCVRRYCSVRQTYRDGGQWRETSSWFCSLPPGSVVQKCGKGRGRVPRARLRHDSGR